MQSLTDVQSDTVLDLVDACRVVSHAWEQEKARRNGEAPAKGSRGEALAMFAQRTYDNAIKGLLDAYTACETVHVTEDVLFGVLGRNLPPELATSVNLGNVA